jgi:hypothetical protein
MTVLASFVLAPLVSLAPQEATPSTSGQNEAAAKAQDPLLNDKEQAAVRAKLMAYLAADEEWSQSSGRARDRASRAREKTREDFDKEWEKHEKKGNLLASMPDLRAIFANCFELKRPSFSLGQLRKETAKEDDVDFSFWLPKAYRPEVPCQTVIVLPGTTASDAIGQWAKPADYWAATWDKAEATKDSIFQICHTPAGLELDPVPDFSRDISVAEEERRYKAVFAGWAHVMANFNVDRAKVFLDCGRGACGFGLRFVSVFPDRFAGVILRDPVTVPDIRLGSLHGKAVLMIKSPATAEAVGELKQRLEEVTPGSVTVVDATDEYPHQAATQAIDEWMEQQHRDMTPKTVVIEPNHDRFNRSYWVDIDRAEPLIGASLDRRPRIEVNAERAANRITVKTQGVESFYLFLNDDLVDLSSEFTVVINGKAMPETKDRQFRDLLERMRVRRDWEYLFPVMFRAEVPKSEGK